jgi:hypothetical protein
MGGPVQHIDWVCKPSMPWLHTYSIVQHACWKCGAQSCKQAPAAQGRNAWLAEVYMHSAAMPVWDSIITPSMFLHVIHITEPLVLQPGIWACMLLLCCVAPFSRVLADNAHSPVVTRF